MSLKHRLLPFCPVIFSLLIYCHMFARWMLYFKEHAFLQGTKKWGRIFKTLAVFITHFRKSKRFLRSSQKIIACVSLATTITFLIIILSCREVWTNTFNFPTLINEGCKRNGIENVCWVIQQTVSATTK